MMARTPVSNGSHVPAGRSPGSTADERPEQRVAAQMVERLVEIEIEVGDAPGPMDEVGEVLPVGQMGSQNEVVLTSGGDFEHSGIPLDDHGSPIDVTFDTLDSWQGPSPEVGGQGRPVEPTLERQTEGQPTVGHQPIGTASTLP